MKLIAPLVAVLLIIVGYIYISTQMTDSNNKYNEYVKKCVKNDGIPFIASKDMFSERVECHAYKLENKSE